MKKLFFAALSLLVLTASSFIPAASSTGTSVLAASPKVEAYYFHFSSRCTTCRTIEAQTKKDIEELYPELVKQGRITFRALNLDEESSKPIAERLNVKAQTLLIVGGKQKINITNDGFRYAVGQPEKFKSIIKEKIDLLLK